MAAAHEEDSEAVAEGGEALEIEGVVDEGVSMTTCEFDALLLWVLSLAL